MHFYVCPSVSSIVHYKNQCSGNAPEVRTPTAGAESYQPHSIPPIGGARYHKGPKIQSRYHVAPQRKLRSPKLKYEAQESSEVRGP